MRTNKKLIIAILITTIIAIMANVFITKNELKIYQNKVDIVIANIVGALLTSDLQYKNINEKGEW